MTDSLLYVADSYNNRQLTLLALKRAALGVDLGVAYDRREAFDYLHRRGKFAGRATAHPLLILLDMKRQRRDGIETLRQLRADPVLVVIPAIMLAAYDDAHDIAQSYELGINAYVTKPVDFDNLVHMLRRIGQFWCTPQTAAAPLRADEPNHIAAQA